MKKNEYIKRFLLASLKLNLSKEEWFLDPAQHPDEKKLNEELFKAIGKPREWRKDEKGR